MKGKPFLLQNAKNVKMENRIYSLVKKEISFLHSFFLFSVVVKLLGCFAQLGKVE